MTTIRQRTRFPAGEHGGSAKADTESLRDELERLKRGSSEREANTLTIVGRVILARCRNDPALADQVLAILDSDIADQEERRVLGLRQAKEAGARKATGTRRPRTVQCPFCARRLATQERLRVHVRQHHPDRLAEFERGAAPSSEGTSTHG